MALETEEGMMPPENHPALDRRPEMVSLERLKSLPVYFAPMEGYTGWLYRRIHQQYFPGIDKYFTPFLSANKNLTFHNRDKKDVAVENNRGVPVVPQIITNSPEHFVWAAEKLYSLGYGEVDLNMGCPSSTVTAKRKGAGMLMDLAGLSDFFYRVFTMISGEGKQGIRVSVKTRLGYSNPEDSLDLAEILNLNPFSEVIVHPRVRADYYREPVRMSYFEDLYRTLKAPLVYNGDIVTKKGLIELLSSYPDLPAVMIGRGLLINPALVREIRGGEPLGKEELQHFFQDLYEGYVLDYGSERNALFKMKDLWKFIILSFQENKRLFKAVVKAKSGAEYVQAAEAFFRETPLLSEKG